MPSCTTVWCQHCTKCSGAKAITNCTFYANGCNNFKDKLLGQFAMWSYSEPSTMDIVSIETPNDKLLNQPLWPKTFGCNEYQYSEVGSNLRKLGPGEWVQFCFSLPLYLCSGIPLDQRKRYLLYPMNQIGCTTQEACLCDRLSSAAFWL